MRRGRYGTHPRWDDTIDMALACAAFLTVVALTYHILVALGT